MSARVTLTIRGGADGKVVELLGEWLGDIRNTAQGEGSQDDGRWVCRRDEAGLRARKMHIGKPLNEPPKKLSH
jgi:hypothetical protein